MEKPTNVAIDFIYKNRPDFLDQARIPYQF